ADTPRGHCTSSLIRCPYHAWTYSANGDLVAVPREKAYRGLDKAEWGLNPVAVEIWNGFVFVSLEPDGATSVAEMMAPFNDELRNYRLPDLQPLGRVTSRPRPVNWKTVTDNYVDGLHIAVAHSGLKNIAARSYRLETSEHVSKMSADLELIGRGGWSERAYLQTLPEVDHLPDERQQHWTYYMLWPNIAFDVYPDQVDFMQMLPVGPEQTLIREISYALPDDRREMRLARYLNWRINRVVNEEDRHLVERVQQGMRSGAFERGPLSDEEICLRHFADKLRRLIPEATRSSESDTK
ncbi:MAG: SRPBCC family protein, partial [Gammaproteobacteria bacterium]